MSVILTSKDVGFRLRQMRLAAGYSMETLSEIVGISVQQLHKYEAGISSMNLKRLQEFASAFSVPVATFVSTEELPPAQASEELLVSSFRAIDDKEIRQSILKLTIHAAKVKCLKP